MAYLLEVTASWAVFYGVYHLLLRAETFHRWNRWYLLTTLLLGLAIPTLDIDLATADATPSYLLQPITVGVQELEAIVVTASERNQGVDFQAVAWCIYWLGVVVAMLRFGYGLWQIRRLYRAGDIAPQQGYDLVTTNAPHLPFSFFDNLFWSKSFEVTEEERRSITRHEEAHIFQKHSHDVVMLELVAAFAWCVPLIYFYKKALKTTHEYLADAHVTAGFDKKQYGRLLLRQSHPGMQVAISNSLFSSQLKKRIVMMTKTDSPQRAGWKYLAVLPALAVLLMAFSMKNSPLPAPLEILENQPVERFEEPDFVSSAMALTDTVPPDGGEIFKVVEEMPRFPGCEDVADVTERKKCSEQQMMEFIFKNIKYPAEAKEKGIEGTAYVKFVIEKDGSITGAEIVRNLENGCGEELKRLVGTMPKWIPGKQRGREVRVQFVLPVKFKLEEEDKKASVDKPLTINDLDEMPVMLGCEQFTGDERKKCSDMKLIEAVFANVKYPAEARKNGVEGTVFAKFIIEKDGSITKPEIIRSVGSGCDEEVLRVVGLMPKWSPGKKDGQPVPVSYTLPVKFKLDEGEKSAKPSEEVVLEAFPNPAGSDGFEVRFKAPAGRVSLLFYDANAMKEVNERFFDVEKGIFTTYQIRPEWLFANGKSGTAAISLRDANGKVLATTKVIVQ
ncbi:MAG: M56 family metallopeptidase [Saprospiraceae bacterium]|nr:M56 family metallopeptidase [Saprospiraceae bacterium]